MFKQMGGNMTGRSATDLNDLDEDEIDSDDEPMPDLEEVPKGDETQTQSSNVKESSGTKK
jgi:hypothetical protein